MSDKKKKKEQGWYQAAIGAAVFAAGVALDDPALVGVGLGTAVGGLSQGLSGNSPATPPAPAPPPQQFPSPAGAGASANDVIQPAGVGQVAQLPPAQMSVMDRRARSQQQLLIVAVVAVFLFSGGLS